eukprot:TRINITY_DN40710_c0_g1_i1.p1 TRINITY_DN40710_c0_g1~~TRINITY_DN40710_c0_g1_i1.p1  ORF type:complete len:377 (+),score=56.91 TRINITY_DN40710_c0_g1_i1:93-1223(+)
MLRSCRVGFLVVFWLSSANAGGKVPISRICNSMFDDGFQMLFDTHRHSIPDEVACMEHQLFYVQHVCGFLLKYKLDNILEAQQLATQFIQSDECLKKDRQRPLLRAGFPFFRDVMDSLLATEGRPISLERVFAGTMDYMFTLFQLSSQFARTVNDWVQQLHGLEHLATPPTLRSIQIVPEKDIKESLAKEDVLSFLIEQISDLKENQSIPLTIAELGSGLESQNAATFRILERKLPSIIHLVDVWPKDAMQKLKGVKYFEVPHWEDSTARIRFKDLALEQGAEVVVHRTPALATSEHFDDATLDAVFLSSLHVSSGEELVGLLERWWSKVRPGGLIAGTNFHLEEPEVPIAIYAFFKDPYEIILSDLNVWFVRKPT